MEYKEVQKIAKDTIEYAKKNIYAGMSLIEIREMCERKMLEYILKKVISQSWMMLHFLPLNLI